MSFLGKMKENAVNPLRLTSLNHVSLLCQSLEESMNFYQKVLGFFPVRRPESLDFEGAWLFGHGIGIHLLGSTEPKNFPRKLRLTPKITISLFSARVWQQWRRSLMKWK
ncbi:unnamed protein product [Brassica oleracea]